MKVLVAVESVDVVVQFVVVGAIILLLLIVVVHIIHRVHLHWRVLRIIFFHDLQVHLVVDLEALRLNLLLPVLVVDLNVVQNRVN